MKPDDAVLLPPGVSRAEVTALRGGMAQVQPDWLAEEVPVSLVFNGLSHAVMLATPADLEDFALGFALTEGLLEHRAELYGIDVEHVAQGIELHLDVSSACSWRLRQRRRALAGRTGCGLCGTEHLAQVRRPLAMAPFVQVPVASMSRAQRDLRQHQALQQLTGGAHAAAWCRLDGSVHLVREDIGRHNALDKLAGAMARQGVDGREGAIVITSRVSVEMVQKCAMAGVPVLVAVSAPTAHALRLAEAAGITLAAIARGDGFEIFTHPERIRRGEQTHVA